MRRSPELQLVALADSTPQPWKNGGGATRELLAWPPGAGAGAGAWALRVSVARIDRDGPFSRFDGIQRCFAVLKGEGVRLSLPGGPAEGLRLTPADDALAFDGADAPGCTLIDGPTDDLNLMARAGAGRLRLQRATTGSGIADPTRWRGLFAQAPARLLIGDHATSVAAETLAWSDDPDTPPWQLAAGHGWWLTLEP